MNITKEEEKVTVAWKEEHNIPGTESLLEMIQAEEMQKKREIRHSFHSFF